MADPRSPAGDALTALVLKVFRLNGQFLDIADHLTANTGLTAARWQVLGAVLPAPLSVADAARSMGLARQSVQRLADALVDDGLCEYRDNPAHQRAKLLAPTRMGWAAIARVQPRQVAWANRVGDAVGADALRTANETLERVLGEIAGSPAQSPRRSRRSPGATGAPRGGTREAARRRTAPRRSSS
jgi:DNA-binding MarR family transcriptional regulator